MLQIKSVKKEYRTNELHQTALNGVSLNLRDNEFVAILGPSGSGKTTLLNIIGGLDRCDDGELIINNISTKKYKDRDWDSYRNHTIGFVFQSYNLIPHQSVLSNVELALTISGISRSERRRRAKQALEQVGLGDQLHKKPNQMSGGQMQRVAIARALVNNPDILLADEPTGALDTETSLQVMELLKEVAKDRLVVMVTHNPELAKQYANRIVNLRDGQILDDSNPYIIDEQTPSVHKNLGKSSMGFLTALGLSFRNLQMKMGRTLLTSFAGSIGIIGIALILSLSTGVNTYIDDIQKSTMTSYPISIEAQSMDLSSVLASGKEKTEQMYTDIGHELDGVYSNPFTLEQASAMTMSITDNNLTAFKQYLDDSSSEIHQYIGENGIVYSYDTGFYVYTYDPEGVWMNTDGSSLETSDSLDGVSMMASMMTDSNANDNFDELLPGQNGQLISDTVIQSYDLLYGSWPTAYDEIVLIVNQNHEISAATLYELGMLPASQYAELMEQIDSGEEISLDTVRWSYEDICRQTFYLIPFCDTYTKNDSGYFDYVAEDADREALAENAVRLNIVGIIRPGEDSDYTGMVSAFGYAKALTDYLISYTDESEVVTAQKASPDRSVLNGAAFSPADDAAKIADARSYLERLSADEKADMCRKLLSTVYGDGSAQMMLSMSNLELAAILDQYVMGSDGAETLLKIYDTCISAGSYDGNMAAFGVVSMDAPSAIRLYVDSFEAKDAVSDCISAYNQTASEEDQISYTDYVGLLMSSITTIINVISYVLIAFVAVSLVVSSIMIGIITYISVLERTKEIGILRAIGASKHNISQVFNAETFIIGLCSGFIGVGVTKLLLIPGNVVIHSLTGSSDINAFLPASSGVILVVLSVILTLIGGLIPSRKASKKDPVTALRSE